MPEHRTDTKAVVFSGGGAYGAYEVGVMKALSSGESAASGKQPLDASVFTGTSVGNFNASVLAMQPGNLADGAKRLEQIWLYEIADRGGARGNGVYRIRGNPPGYLENTGFKNPFEPLLKAAGDAAYLGGQWAMRATHFMMSGGTLSNRALGLIDLSAFICVDPFIELLQRTITPALIRSSPKALRIIATNWESGDIKVFTNRDITDDDGRSTIMASASIPGIFPPVRIGANTYVDGSIVLNTPVSYALDAGATEVHVIYMTPDIRTVPLESGESTIDVFDRVLAAVMSNTVNQDIAIATSINKGLEALDRVAADVPLEPSHATNLLRIVSKIHKSIEADQPYRKITIHRHRPTKDLGGAMAILNFSQGQIRDLIELGYNDARAHDCERNGCVIPDRTYETVPRAATLKAGGSGA